jgi:hypothetical protein
LAACQVLFLSDDWTAGPRQETIDHFACFLARLTAYPARYIHSQISLMRRRVRFAGVPKSGVILHKYFLPRPLIVDELVGSKI